MDHQQSHRRTPLAIALPGSAAGRESKPVSRIAEPFIQFRPPLPSRDIAHGDGDSLLLADQHNQPFAACHAGVEQIPLQHNVVLGQNGDDDGGILRTLALVNGCSVCRNQRVKLAEAISDGAPVVLPPLSVGEMMLRHYGAFNYSQNSARDLRCALNGA